MRISINGQWEEFSDAPSVAELLESRSLQPRRVAVELNRRIVPRGHYGETRLSENDALEIVTLVGGG
ncbi:MAG: sulfur carrier protein ThiS [Phycisphaerae bacterium]|jgi:thiamine biosynthesis protein ThiS